MLLIFKKILLWSLFVLLLVLLLAGGGVLVLRKTIRPPVMSKKQALALLPKLPDMLDKVLVAVDNNGLVDYKKLRKHPKALNQVLAVIAQVSPANAPHLFHTSDARLAYWINAYNAAVLRNVLEFEGWKDMFSQWRKIRFFALNRYVFGGKRWNLLDLENKWLRPRFREPLVHFAINCASFGCPNFPQKAFRAKDLQKRLRQEARRFFVQKRNVRVDSATKTIYLSPILLWFRSDFIKWGLSPAQVQKLRLQKQEPLLFYVNQYRPKGRKLPTSGVKLRFVDYDWRLNTRHGPARNSPLRR